jgi:hypothetical protein
MRRRNKLAQGKTLWGKKGAATLRGNPAVRRL